MNASRIRKQVDQLTAQDFDDSSVWEFALDEEGDDGQDEATVRPYLFEGSLDPSDGMFIARARFALADGTTLPGYMTLPFQGDAGLATLQPVVLTTKGQVLFWFGSIDPGTAFIADLYSRMGKSSSTQVFPIRFESAVALVGGAVRGEIPGFLILEDFQTGRTRVVA